MPKSIGIVDVLAPGDDLIDPLADKRVYLLRDVARVAGVGDAADHVGTETELLIELPNQHQARIGRECACGEIDDEFLVGI
jgi:hypothetical protein